MFWVLIHFVLIFSDSVTFQFTEDELLNYTLVFEFLNSSFVQQERRILHETINNELDGLQTEVTQSWEQNEDLKRNIDPTPAPTNPPKWEKLYSGLECRTGGPEFRSECIEVSQAQINKLSLPTQPAHLGVCQPWASVNNYSYIVIHAQSYICCGVTECNLQNLFDSPGWSVYAYTSLKYCGTITNNDPTSVSNEALTGKIAITGPTSNNSCIVGERVTTSSTNDDVEYVCPKREYMINPFQFYIDIPCGDDGNYQESIRACQEVYLDRLTHPTFPWMARLATQFFLFSVVIFHKYFYFLTHCQCIRRFKKRKFKTPEERELHEANVFSWQYVFAFLMCAGIFGQMIWDFFYIYEMYWFYWALFFTQRPPFQLLITYYFIYYDGLVLILSILSFPIRPILRMLSQESGEPPYVGFTLEPLDAKGQPKDPVQLDREKKVGLKWANRKKMLSIFFASLVASIFVWSTFLIFLFIVFGGIFYMWVHMIMFGAFNCLIPVLMWINNRYTYHEKEDQPFQFKIPEEIAKNWEKVRWHIKLKQLFKGAWKYYFSWQIVNFFYIWQVWFIYTSMHILGFWVYGNLYQEVGYMDGVYMLLSPTQWDQLYARSCEHTYWIGLQLISEQPDCLEPPWKDNSCDYE